MQKTPITNALNNKQDYWPTPIQELLLRASLVKSNVAKKAWEDWKSAVDVERLDTESNLLLPLLYTNLLRLEVKDSLMSKFKGIYRYTWYKNQLSFYKISNPIHSFNQERIQTMIINVVPLITISNGQQGSRLIDEFDLLVPKKKASSAISLLMKLGWSPNTKSPENLITLIHPVRFKDSDGPRLYLHCHILHESHDNISDHEFWDAAASIKIHNASTLALNPTDQLMNVCVHGVRESETRSVRRVISCLGTIPISLID